TRCNRRPRPRAQAARRRGWRRTRWNARFHDIIASMRAYRWAALAAALACACSLITHLDPPNDGGGGGGDGGPLCVPVVIADVGDAMVTSLVADSVSGRAYFSGNASGRVYAVPLDAAADAPATTLATFTGPRRLATAQVKVMPESYVYVTTIGGGAVN